MTQQPASSAARERCDDYTFRLAVYQSGHALVAWCLGLKILRLRMLPRPPVLSSEKAFRGRDWTSFAETLDIRVMELIGGQIAEELTCGASSCCSGDVSRIDELTRLLSALGDGGDHEEIWFQLEDTARGFFDDPVIRAAIVPMAEFIAARIAAGDAEIDGAEIEARLGRLLPPRPRTSRLRRFFGLGPASTPARDRRRETARDGAG